MCSRAQRTQKTIISIVTTILQNCVRATPVFSRSFCTTYIIRYIEDIYIHSCNGWLWRSSKSIWRDENYASRTVRNNCKRTLIPNARAQRCVGRKHERRILNQAPGVFNMNKSHAKQTLWWWYCCASTLNASNISNLCTNNIQLNVKVDEKNLCVNFKKDIWN